MKIRLQSICVATLLVAFVFTLGSQANAHDAKFEWKEDEKAGLSTLTWHGKPVLQYVHAFDRSSPELQFDTGKVFHHVYGPLSGDQITKGPGGKYPHHRGLYIGWNKTQFEETSMDFWHVKKGEHQRHVEFVSKTGNEKAGSMTAKIHWNDRDDKLVISESRTVSVQRVKLDKGNGETAPAWQIDWYSSLQSHRGTITLDGDRQHAGFQFRADQPVAESENARYIRPAGFPQQAEAYQVNDKGEPKHVNLGWLAMSYELRGKNYTVEYLEDTSLPKPARYSERPYGRFGAFHKVTLEQKEGERFFVHYRVFVSEGKSPTQEAIQKRHDAFLEDLKNDKH